MTGSMDTAVCLRIGVTAHRDLSQVDQESLRARVQEFFTSLQQNFPDLPIVVVNPLAPGGDMLVAEVALELGLALDIPLPMPLECLLSDYDSVALKDRFNALCQQGQVYELPLVAGNDLEDIRHYGPGRDLQYAQVGCYVADHSHILLALWDGEDNRLIGDAASVVNFQLHNEMPGFTPPVSGSQMLAEKESDLVYHIQCPRREGNSLESTGRWLSNAGSFPGADMPEPFRVPFHYMQEFRADLRRHHNAIDVQGDTLIEDELMRSVPGLVQIDRVYRSADWLALRYRKLVVRELQLTHGLAVLMGASFILYSEYMEFSFLLPAFILFFLAAWLITRIANLKQWHRKYLDNRALAEGLRVQFYWTLADTESFEDTAFAYDNLMQKQDVELVWIRHIMRAVSVAGRVSTDRIPNGLELAIRHWIGDEDKGTGQLGYYTHAASERERKLRRNSLYGRLTLWCGMAIAGLLLAVGDTLGDLSTNILLILMGMLPLMAAIREAYAYKKADKELTKQYQFMHKTFGIAHKKLAQLKEPEDKAAIIRALGEACLEEHSEWILIHRERPLEHSGLHA